MLLNNVIKIVNGGQSLRQERSNKMGYDISTEFIGKPHESSPRRLYSQTGADWQYRVDFDRMRLARLQRTREQMEAFDLGALVLFAGANIRQGSTTSTCRLFRPSGMPG